MTVRSLLALLCFAALLLGAAAPARAQNAQNSPRALPASGSISGRIVDATTGLPLAGTVVALEPLAAGALPARGAGGSAFLQGTRSVLTGPAGEYGFPDLPPGSYRLHAQRIGYTALTVEVELRHATSTRLSMGMGIEPLALHPLDVEVTPLPAYLRTRSAAAEIQGARAAIEQRRQYDFLTSDVRALTHGEVVEAVTLGETDLFRALQRVPGVSARDDYTAILWTRGALWDQTRIYFDGLPLYNPTHAGWTVAGVNPEAIGVAFFHPGVRSAALGEGAAGVLDLKSRPGGTRERLQGSSELSLISLRLAMDGPLQEGRGGWMFAARRSYLDWLTQALESWTGAEDAHIPYRFTDFVARADLRLAEGWALEASALREWDRITGDLPDLLQDNRARWGNSAGRLTLHSPFFGALRARHTLGTSWYSATVDQTGPPPLVPAYTVTAPPMDNVVAYAAVGTEIEPMAVDGEAPRWSAGAQLVRQGAGYDGSVFPPIPLLFTGATRLAAPAEPDAGWRSGPGFPVNLDSYLGYGVLWGERRWFPFERLTLQSGMRVEAGQFVENGGSIRFAPRLAARFRPAPDLALSAGWSRSFQYAQAVAPAGIPVGPQLHLSHIWVLAGEGVPAVRSEIATLGVERWVGPAWIAAANAYHRHASGMALPDPTPGVLMNRPLFVEAENSARGIELSLRRLTGRWTAALGYAYAVSQMDAAELRFPSSADRRHTLDATSALRVGEHLRLGAAFSAASGAPFTRYFVADSPRIDLPNAHRAPPYASLDLLTEYTRRIGSVELGAYLQLRNALGRENAITYSGSEALCPESLPISRGGEGGDCRSPLGVLDHFERGLPRLPIVGLRMSF